MIKNGVKQERTNSQLLQGPVCRNPRQNAPTKCFNFLIGPQIFIITLFFKPLINKKKVQLFYLAFSVLRAEKVSLYPSVYDKQ